MTSSTVREDKGCNDGSRHKIELEDSRSAGFLITVLSDYRFFMTAVDDIIQDCCFTLAVMKGGVWASRSYLGNGLLRNLGFAVFTLQLVISCAGPIGLRTE